MASMEAVQELSREQLEQAANLHGIATEGVSDEDLQKQVSEQATPEEIAGLLTANPNGGQDPAVDEPTDPTAGTNNESDTLNNPDDPEAPATPEEPAAPVAPEAPAEDDKPTDPVEEQAKTSEPLSEEEGAESAGTVYARLVKSFDHPRGHRRAGFQFELGPVPQKLEVTKAQKAALEADTSIELVDEAEFEKRSELQLTPVQEGSTPEQQDPALVAGEETTRGATTGRNRRYATDPTRKDSPELDGASERLGATVTDPAAGDETTTPVELTDDLKVKDLVAIAKAEGVEDADSFSKPGTSKATIREAIEANRVKE